MARRDVLYGRGAVGASVFAVRKSRARVSSTSTARTAVNFRPPLDACDCHVHVFDPARFPYAAKRVYTPPQALIEDLLDLQKALRMDRVVIVQPSVYGADNSCTLDAVRKLGARARGVAVIDKDTSQTEIDEMAAAGIRGIRLNLNTTPNGEIDADGSKRTLDLAAEKIQGRGWHIQFYTRPHVIAALKSHIEQLPFPVVFDHFGGAKAAEGPNQPGFDALLDLVKSGRAYVKISGSYRISDKGPDFSDAAPIGAGAYRGKSGSCRLGLRLAASRFRVRTRSIGNRATVLHRRWPGAQPVAEMDCRSCDPGEDPGRQRRAALRLRGRGEQSCPRTGVDG